MFKSVQPEDSSVTIEINQETLDVLITKFDFAVQVSHRAF